MIHRLLNAAANKNVTRDSASRFYLTKKDLGSSNEATSLLDNTQTSDAILHQIHIDKLFLRNLDHEIHIHSSPSFTRCLTVL
jgi:hypothetical protein